MSDYAIQIAYNEQYVSENGQTLVRPKIIILDSVDDSTISASNTITTHPIVSGDLVSDHSYKNPQTYSFSGSIGSVGHKGVVVDSDGISLANFEELIMNLKDNAYLCEIVKICVNNNEDIRFVRRSNMVLESVQFTEKISSLTYTLSFRQVLVSQVQEFDVDTDDAYLPNVTEPQTTSFTDALIDWAQVDATVISELYGAKLMTDQFLQYLQSLSQTALLSIVGAAVGAAIAVKIVSALGVALSAPGVGWVGAAIGAAIIAAWGIVKLIVQIVENAKYTQKQFKYYNDDKKNNAEVQRFSNFIGEIHKQLEQLNDVIYVYSINSNEDQEAMISIDDTYYIFTFTKNNVSGVTKCVVTDQENAVRGTLANVASSPTNYNACNVSNALFRSDVSGSYVYIINASQTNEFSLQNCFICVSKINPEEYTSTLAEVVRNALTR